MDDDASEELADDESTDDEWEVDERELPESLNYPARAALDYLLRHWQTGMRARPADILQGAEVFVRERPEQYGTTVEMQHAVDIIDAYDIMGYIDVERSEGSEPIVVGVRPVYFRQSDALRGEMIGRRQDRQDRDRRRREDEAKLGGAIEAMGLSRENDVATIAAKLQAFGLALKTEPRCFPMTSCVAIVWKPGSGNDRGYKGVGDSESEALCFAAAYAFLASAGAPQA